MKKVIIIAAMLMSACANTALIEAAPTEAERGYCQYLTHELQPSDSVNVYIVKSTSQVINGIVCKFYEDGSLQYAIPYQNGMQEGVRKLYSQSGILLEEITYHYGREDGIKRKYSESGIIKSETTIKGISIIQGVTIESEKLYYENGELEMEILFKNDEPVSGYCWDGREITAEEFTNWEETEISCADR